MENRPLQVAVIGAGPAGIYASDILAKANVDVRIDLYEKVPAPYGLVRYGVAPDHPRIKQIIKALYNILQRGDIRLVGNVEVGKDITFAELRAHYDAIIIATGADRDRPFVVPGSDLPEVYGAADFVYWYDGHPDYPRTWDLNAKEIAVLGVGNVALDVARILAKHPQDLMQTEIPENVAQGLQASPVTDVHVFGRRGPAQVKFSPMELRELGEVPDVDIIVYEEDFDYDEASEAAVESTKMTRLVVNTLTDYLLEQEEPKTASRRIHLHMLQQPAEILGSEHVQGIRMERTALQGDGTVAGTGEFIDYPVQAVYRAMGYFSSAIPGVPFDTENGVVPNVAGRVTDGVAGEVVTGAYATGWVKRGPVGLIGSTKSDAQETIANLVADYDAGKLQATTAEVGWDAMREVLNSKGVRYTNWQGWELLEEYEKSLGAAVGRERIKVVERDTMTAISRNEPHDRKLY